MTRATPRRAASTGGRATPPSLRESLPQRFARAAYSSLLRLGLPAYLLRVLWRGRAEPLYRAALGERVGFYRGAPPLAPGALWIHAVSLGETRAAAPLIDALRERLPGVRLLLTHGTATGRAAGASLLRDGDAQAWLPFDTPGAVRRFVRRFRPAAGVLLETEVWPNLIAEATRLGVPMLLVNARLSERSRRRGRRVDALLRPAFARLAHVAAQTGTDAERLLEVGARCVEVLGNLKFDLTPDAATMARGRAWRGAVGERRVVLAAVTREGEEARLLASWQRVAAPPLLVIVPRHPQRFDAVADLVVEAGFTLARRSRWDDAPSAADGAADVWLGDSMMEMPAWYVLADVALLGGSFAPLGGQNLIEAAACGCPLVVGPHTFNFEDAAERAIEAGAAARVPDIDAAVERALAWLEPGAADARRDRAARAFAFASAHRGAAASTAERIAQVLAGRADEHGG
ncbi:3-deoxy-D-manno-octulosonic acid transferase [Schlegelella sp. ID0723]|uniref:3-deoxy-D-manno-octulosonic acid transferase n=2 Tax=Piscinibacter koreensis TaxID=2742824 RepID=A0A7Y6NMN4_9BURK|nr:3-deoxy-D-manno-octulosonic acid transferase [Schlegelella koreensis]NUZ06008.1 3-deoxy-D-manno-octulosonic acid transferase [Schlegelella koreensis]